MQSNPILELPPLDEAATAEQAHIIELIKQQIVLKDQFSQLTKYVEACMNKIGQLEKMIKDRMH